MTQDVVKAFLILTLGGFILMLSTTHADEIPSCTVLAKLRSSPGASPPCAPQIIDNDAAFKALAKIQKLNFSYYLFLTDRQWQSVAYKDRWNSLAFVVSAIQSLYDANAEVFFIATPVSELETTLGQFPQTKIKAQARYMVSETMSLHNTGNIVPPGHKERLYTLIVY